MANAGLIKRDYVRNTADLRNEESLKLIQNSLRQDLFLLLTGVTLEKDEDKDRDKSKGKSKGKGKRYSFKDASGSGKAPKDDKSAGASKSANGAKPPKNPKTSKTAEFSKAGAMEPAEVDERNNRADVIPTPASEADTPATTISGAKTEAAAESNGDTTEDA